MSDTKKNILNYIKNKGSVTVKEIIDTFGISRQAAQKHLSELIKLQIIEKVGSTPKVFYSVKNIKKSIEVVEINPEVKKIIAENYLIITPAGEMKEGLEGFSYWCERNKLQVAKTADEYVKTLEKYNVWKKDGLIDGIEKIKTSFGDRIGLDKVFYLDFYAIERFGKTKLGQILLYAKNSQDKKLMRRISEASRDTILEMIGRYDIDAVGFIPPTVKRQVQLMKELKTSLALPLREINIVKARTEVIVPQKTLTKIEDRTENAQKSIFVSGTNSENKYRNILLIDDAVGSGATLNETALQIKRLGICSGKIIGLAITGSFKGFDVISEV
jgi:DNA-binding Lrp family transcriptional regulator